MHYNLIRKWHVCIAPHILKLMMPILRPLKASKSALIDDAKPQSLGTQLGEAACFMPKEEKSGVKVEKSKLPTGIIN